MGPLQIIQAPTVAAVAPPSLHRRFRRLRHPTRPSCELPSDEVPCGPSERRWRAMQPASQADRQNKWEVQEIQGHLPLIPIRIPHMKTPTWDAPTCRNVQMVWGRAPPLTKLAGSFQLTEKTLVLKPAAVRRFQSRQHMHSATPSIQPRSQNCGGAVLTFQYPIAANSTLHGGFLKGGTGFCQGLPHAL